MTEGSRKRLLDDDINDRDGSFHNDEKLAFLRSVLGDHVGVKQLQQLLTQSKGDLQLAANSYFTNPDPHTAPVFMNTAPDTPAPFFSNARNQKNKQHADAIERRERFYIGDTVVTGWATFTGSSPLQASDSVIIERNKPTKTVQYTKRSKTQNNPNTIVRFSTLSGNEVGRFPRDIAKFVSLLMDLELCDFKATVVWCDPTLRTGDDILLHMRCYLRKSAFESQYVNSPVVPKQIKLNQKTSRSVASSSSSSSSEDAEIASRNRTLALLSLLRTLGLRPTKSAVQHANASNDSTDGNNDVFDQISHAIKTTTTEPADAKTPENGDEGNDNDDDKKDVTDGQLDDIYEMAQVFDAKIKPMEQPSSLALTLKPYQQRALAWMVTKESIISDENEVDIRSMHPLWEEYRFPKDPNTTIDDDSNDFFYFNPYNGQLDLIFPEINTQERGGILADEMGLGKTIEMLSLIHSNRYDSKTMSLEGMNSSPTTLIVCPMALLAQWRDEVVRGSLPDTMSVEVYYGGSRPQEIKQRYCSQNAPDVLVTTYGVVMGELNRTEGTTRGSNFTLFDVDFWRVVLDEAHHIKNRRSKTAIACHSLKSTRRWALTGTPIQNKMEDLFSLVRFLKYEPWGNYTFWRTFVTIPFERKDPKALSTVKTILEPLVLRRTKNMRDKNGDSIVPLPGKQVSIEYLDFSEPEKDIYESLFKDSKTKFSHFCAAGTNLRNYASILQLLTRLRQATCHPYLALKKSTGDGTSGKNGGNGVVDDALLTDNGGRISIEGLLEKYNHSSMATMASDSPANEKDTDAMDIDEGDNITDGDRSYGASVLKNLLEQQRGGATSKSNESIPDECPICFEPIDSVIMLPCMHMGCRSCVMEYLQKKENQNLPGDCPICRHGPIHENDLLEISKQEESSNTMTASSMLDIRRAVGGYKSSTKIDALLRHLKQYIRDGHRTVVFSQFTGFLDMIQVALKLHKIEFVRFDGTLSQAQREKVLDKFTKNACLEGKDDQQQPMVMLISLRAGGVGLNLTCASRAVIMDPWWNFAVEAQAIDRVHRLGQVNDVIVTRFIMKDSVEEQILDIQNRKHAMMNELYRSKDEQKAQLLQDLQRIFGVGAKNSHHHH